MNHVAATNFNSGVISADSSKRAVLISLSIIARKSQKRRVLCEDFCDIHSLWQLDGDPRQRREAEGVSQSLYGLVENSESHTSATGEDNVGLIGVLPGVWELLRRRDLFESAAVLHQWSTWLPTEAIVNHPR